MAKNEPSGRKGTVSPKASSQVSGPGSPPGDGSSGVWTDQYGRLCIGTECFHAAVDAERKEIRVVIDESGPCGSASQDDIKAVTDALKQTVAAGADTVYATPSRRA